VEKPFMPNDTTIRYFTDAHIPKSVVTQLRQHGVDIIRCEDIGMKYAKDEAQLEYATKEGRTLVTCDEDFFRLAAQWREAGKHHAGIVYIVSEKQGIIGVIVKELLFLHQAVEGGAASLQDDIYNQTLYIS
jgi:predicted nuclease of predicted toxin-antitoxin system